MWESYYEARTVGVQRYYTAMEHAAQADAVVRVPRYYGIAPDTDRITLSPVDHKDTGVYKVLQVQHVMDNDGLSATDITLEGRERWMEALKQALLALTHNVYNFTAAPGTAPPYLVWQVDGGNDLSAGNIHVETAAVVIVDLFTKQAADPLAQSVPRAMEGIGASWYLNSTQYETETGLYHYEWYVEVV